jgi:hypothetical protein
MLYFDNHPHGHYGTIRQQVWSLLHFPLQLAIVGVVEGSQQITLARYVIKSWLKLADDVGYYCGRLGYEGEQLYETLAASISHFQLDSKVESSNQLFLIQEDLWRVGNETGLCVPENFTGDSLPLSIETLLLDVLGGIYQSLGMKLPADKDPGFIATKSWKVVYIYYWTCVLVLLLCLMTFLYLIRKGSKSDIFDYFSMIARGIGVVLSIGFLVVSSKDTALYDIVSSPAILPVVVATFFIILCMDNVGRGLSNWRLRRSGVVVDGHGDHGHGGEHKPHETGNSKTGTHVNAEAQPATPLEHPTTYDPSVSLQYSYMPHYMTTEAPYSPGEYMPVNNGRNVA